MRGGLVSLAALPILLSVRAGFPFFVVLYHIHHHCSSVLLDFDSDFHSAMEQ
jgi:hypothetical protein